MDVWLCVLQLAVVLVGVSFETGRAVLSWVSKSAFRVDLLVQNPHIEWTSWLTWRRSTLLVVLSGLIWTNFTFAMAAIQERPKKWTPDPGVSKSSFLAWLHRSMDFSFVSASMPNPPGIWSLRQVVRDYHREYGESSDLTSPEFPLQREEALLHWCKQGDSTLFHYGEIFIFSIFQGLEFLHRFNKLEYIIFTSLGALGMWSRIFRGERLYAFAFFLNITAWLRFIFLFVGSMLADFFRSRVYGHYTPDMMYDNCDVQADECDQSAPFRRLDLQHIRAVRNRLRLLRLPAKYDFFASRAERRQEAFVDVKAFLETNRSLPDLAPAIHGALGSVADSESRRHFAKVLIVSKFATMVHNISIAHHLYTRKDLVSSIVANLAADAGQFRMNMSNYLSSRFASYYRHLLDLPALMRPIICAVDLVHALPRFSYGISTDQFEHAVRRYILQDTLVMHFSTHNGIHYLSVFGRTHAYLVGRTLPVKDEILKKFNSKCRIPDWDRKEYHELSSAVSEQILPDAPFREKEGCDLHGIINQARALVIIADGEFANVAFAALLLRGMPLGLQKLITYAASLVDLGNVRPWTGLPRQCASLVLSDPSAPVYPRTSASVKATRWSRTEASTLQDIFEKAGPAVLLSGGECGCEAARDHIVGQDLVHVSAPVYFDAQAPLSSAICMADGEHLHLSDEEIAEERLSTQKWPQLVAVTHYEGSRADPLPLDVSDILADCWRAAAVLSMAWCTDHLSSCIWLRRFYDALLKKRLHPAEALQEATAYTAGLSRKQILQAAHNIPQVGSLTVDELEHVSMGFFDATPDQTSNSSFPNVSPFHWAAFKLTARVSEQP